MSEAFPFFVVSYYDAPGELRNKTDGSLVETLAADVLWVYPVSEAASIFVVRYYSAPGELRNKTDGSLVKTLAGNVNGVSPVSEAFPFFAVYYDAAPGELRNKTDGSLVASVAGNVDGVYPVSEAFPFFVVSYDAAPGELRNKTDGSLVETLAGNVDRVDPVSEAASFFMVYYDDAPGELRNKTDGSLYERSVAQITYDPTASAAHFWIRRNNQRTELWQLDPPQQLVDLNIGIEWNDEQIVANGLHFDHEQQTLAIRYEDRRADLLDLAWLAELADATGPITDTIDFSCLPFATRPFDMTILNRPEYLGDQPPRACQDAPGLLAQGRGLARMGRVDEAIVKFQAALALDPSLPVKPENDAKVLAAATYRTQGRQLVFDGNIDAALAHFEQATKLDPARTGLPGHEVLVVLKEAIRWFNDKNDDKNDAAQRIGQALALAQPQLLNSAADWHTLCRWGSLYGFAEQVVNGACQWAIAAATADQLAALRDSRGLARALTGDVAGAVADFKFYVQQVGGNASHERWIERLAASEDPETIFNYETLEVLKNE